MYSHINADVDRPQYSLVGVDGNAFSIMGFVSYCMKCEKFTLKEIHEYYEKAKSSDYNNLLCVSMEYVDMCNERYFNRINNS